MVYNLGFVIFFTNFSKTIGGGGVGFNSKEPKCGMLIRFFIKLTFETFIVRGKYLRDRIWKLIIHILSTIFGF